MTPKELHQSMRNKEGRRHWETEPDNWDTLFFAFTVGLIITTVLLHIVGGLIIQSIRL